MGLTVCPAAVVAAPVEVVWENLVRWEHYADWADVQVERLEPAGPAAVGQTVSFAGKAFGRTARFRFKVEQLDPDRFQFGVHAYFPFRIQEKTLVTCAPLDATTCRVQYG